MSENKDTGDKTAVGEQGCSASKGLCPVSAPSDVAGGNIHSPHSHRLNWSDLGLHNYIKVLIIAGLLYFLFRHDFHRIIGRWGEDGSWSHGFIIPLFSLYFLNRYKEDILNAETRPAYLGLGLLICVILFYIFNVVSPSGYAYFRFISIIAAIGAVVLFLGGWRLIKCTWLPIAFLVFAIQSCTRSHSPGKGLDGDIIRAHSQWRTDGQLGFSSR